MKRKVKVLLTALFAATTMALTVVASGCSLKDTIKQIGCEHDYGAVATEVLEEPTCMKEGKALLTCVKCGKEKKEKIEKIDHSFDSGTVTKAASCTAEGEKVFKCLNEGCKQTKKEAIAKTEHKRVSVAMVAPTCTTVGATAYEYCSDCNTYLVPKKEIPALGHSVVVDSAVAVTCTTDGKTAGKHCKTCNAILEKQTVIPATGHDVVIDPAVEATCGDGLTAGSHCATCEEILVAQEVIPGNGQHGTPIAVEEKAPTCEEDGSTAGTVCPLCGEILSGCEEIPALGHEEVGIVTAKAATCTENGNTAGVKCSRCDTVFEEPDTILALGHDEEVLIEAKAATCVSSGTTASIECHWCRAVLSEANTIPALNGGKGHALDEDNICTICGYEDVYLAYQLSADGTYAKVAAGDQSFPRDVFVASSYAGVPVEEVVEYAFEGLQIESVYLPESVLLIGESAFENSYLVAIYAAGVRLIEENAFEGCIYLEYVLLPEYSEQFTIEQRGFCGCDHLQEIIIPDGVGSIDQDAFARCQITIKMLSDTPPRFGGFRDGSIYDIYQVVLLNGGRDAYMADEAWAVLGDKIVNA